MTQQPNQKAVRTRPRKVGKGSRTSLVKVVGTRWPVIAYHADVLQSVFGPGLATPEVKLQGGEITEVRYSAIASHGDLLVQSTVLTPKAFSEYERNWVDSKIKLLENSRKAEEDRSRRRILESFDLPDPEKWPNAYRRTGHTEEPLVIVDWGLSRAMSDEVPLRAYSDRIASSETLREKTLTRPRVIAAGVLLVIVIAAIALFAS